MCRYCGVQAEDSILYKCNQTIRLYLICIGNRMDLRAIKE